MNLNTFTGRLTKDPESNTTAGGTTVCELRIAVDDRNGTVYLPVTTFAALADSVARYLSMTHLTRG